MGYNEDDTVSALAFRRDVCVQSFAGAYDSAPVFQPGRDEDRVGLEAIPPLPGVWHAVFPVHRVDRRCVPRKENPAMKRILAVLFALILSASSLAFAAAEEETAPQTIEPTSHILVVYFSATGTTKGVAEKLAEGLSADLYEIVPEEPYTDADLNWNDRKSRTSIEMDDFSCRPAFAGELPDLAAWDTVLIGYPIWWGDVPRIVSNFVENVDLTDKTLAVFFTSGGSGLGSSMKHLEEQAGAGSWLEGRRFTAGVTVEELANWAKGLGIEP